MSKTYLIIAGHGHQRDGTFDPGATGFITKGEHRYMVENLFPLMKKYVPKDAKVIFYDKLKVSNHGNLVRLVNEYGADEVVELHYDAFTNQARGGHVIIHSDYSPDDMDLRIRDAIGSMVGLRFNHRGHQGISGRSNLFNVNMARNNGITYRLLELGFGTNRTDADIMLQRTDEYAKKLVEAILNAKVEDKKPAKNPVKPLGHSYTVQSGDTLSAIAKKYNTTVAELVKHNELANPDLIRVGEDIEIPKAVVQPKPKPAPTKSIDELAGEVIDGKHGVGDARRKSLGSQFSAVQARVNELLTPSRKSSNEIAKEVLDGKWGNNPQRAERLRQAGYNPSEIQSLVNRLASPPRKSVDQVAREIINGQGGWGNNPQRAERLRAAGYDPAAVQRRVNQLI